MTYSDHNNILKKVIYGCLDHNFLKEIFDENFVAAPSRHRGLRGYVVTFCVPSLSIHEMRRLRSNAIVVRNIQAFTQGTIRVTARVLDINRVAKSRQSDGRQHVIQEDE